MRLLGVFKDIYGAEGITFGQTLLISLFGFAVVFIILGFLSVFVFLTGKFFHTFDTKKAYREEIKNEAALDVQTKGVPLPENRSEGRIVLKDVSEDDAAVIMAIISYKSKIPLNRLKFNSIKLLEDKDK